MERLVSFFGLYVGLDIFQLCNGFPVDSPASAGFPHAGLWTSVTPFLAVALLISSVLLLAGCLCCRQTKGFQEFTDSTSSHSLSGGGGFVNNAASTAEFTIFPPVASGVQQQRLSVPSQTPGDRSSVVRFEPLPDLKPPQPHSKRPAAFNNVYNSLSAQDWFEDPYVNFPRHQLKYLKELGRGWFGQAVEGEAQGIVFGEKTTKVVVKILHEDATATDHMYFLHEVKPYRDLKHPNILKLLGQCLETDPFLILLEACPSGDLKSFLSQNISTAEALSHQGVTLLMSCNIATGLQYMHQNNFVHTDLAARNCLVTSDLTVKIGDYGTSIENFKDDYYCAGEVALPIRWCAPETLHCTETTIETKEVTPGANVWNLGIVLWEICEFGKLPYSDLTDDEVIVKVLGEGTHRLQIPSSPCLHRHNLYHLMKLCWSPAPQRPALPQVLAMLNHLYSNREYAGQDGDDSCNLKADEDFERRWETFKPNTIPKTDNHLTSNQVQQAELHQSSEGITPSLFVVNSLGDRMANNEGGQSCEMKPFVISQSGYDDIISPQDATNLLSYLSSPTPLTTSPQPSLTSSSGGEFFHPTLQQHHRSPSLQNLRGSLDDLYECNGETDSIKETENIQDKEQETNCEKEESKTNKVENEENSTTEVNSTHDQCTEMSLAEPDFDSWLQGVETTDEEDAKFVRKISEAIRDLDNALALEKTSSSSSSESSSNSSSHHQSPAKEVTPLTEDQNVVLDFRLGPAVSHSSVNVFSQKECTLQPDSLQDDSLHEKSVLRLTDSGTDTEDETWRRRIECGEFSAKVKEKSKSVADLMILTHIECSDGSDSEPPSPILNVEKFPSGRNSISRQCRNSNKMYNLSTNNGLTYGSEGNIHQAVLVEEFRDTLRKLHEAQKDTRNLNLGLLMEQTRHDCGSKKLTSDSLSCAPPTCGQNNFLVIDASEGNESLSGEILNPDISKEFFTMLPLGNIRVETPDGAAELSKVDIQSSSEVCNVEDVQSPSHEGCENSEGNEKYVADQIDNLSFSVSLGNKGENEESESSECTSNENVFPCGMMEIKPTEEKNQSCKVQAQDDQLVSLHSSIDEVSNPDINFFHSNNTSTNSGTSPHDLKFALCPKYTSTPCTQQSDMLEECSESVSHDQSAHMRRNLHFGESDVIKDSTCLPEPFSSLSKVSDNDSHNFLSDASTSSIYFIQGEKHNENYNKFSAEKSVEVPESSPILDSEMLTKSFPTESSDPESAGRYTQASVIIGPCEDHTLDYFVGLKTTSGDIYFSDDDEADFAEKSMDISETIKHVLDKDNSYFEFNLENSHPPLCHQVSTVVNNAVAQLQENECLLPTHNNISIPCSDDEKSHEVTTEVHCTCSAVVREEHDNVPHEDKHNAPEVPQTSSCTTPSRNFILPLESKIDEKTCTDSNLDHDQACQSQESNKGPASDEVAGSDLRKPSENNGPAGKSHLTSADENTIAIALLESTSCAVLANEDQCNDLKSLFVTDSSSVNPEVSLGSMKTGDNTETNENILGRELLIPHLNFIAATPVSSGRNTPLDDDSERGTNGSPQLPINIQKAEETTAGNSAMDASEKENPSEEVFGEGIEEESMNTDNSEMPLFNQGININDKDKQEDSGVFHDKQRMLHLNASSCEQEVEETYKSGTRSDRCDTKTDTCDASHIVSQLIKEVPSKVVPLETEVQPTLIEEKQTMHVMVPLTTKTDLFFNKIVSPNSIEYDQLNFQEKQILEKSLQMSSPSKQFLFNESGNILQHDLFDKKNATVEKWNGHNRELVTEELLQTVLDENDYHQKLMPTGEDMEVHDITSRLNVDGPETTVELEDDGEDFGLDVAKHSTPDDERSSDSGFRDKGSLSESCEDACDEKYNLEDIEAELEETFNKGGFNYVRKGVDIDDDTDQNAAHLSVIDDSLKVSELELNENMLNTSCEKKEFCNEPCFINDAEITDDSKTKNGHFIDEDTCIIFNAHSVEHSTTDISGKVENYLDKNMISMDKKYSSPGTPDLLNIETSDMPLPDLTVNRSRNLHSDDILTPTYISLVPEEPLRGADASMEPMLSDEFDVTLQSAFSKEKDIILDIGQTEFRTLSPEQVFNSFYGTSDHLQHKQMGWFLHAPSSGSDLLNMKMNFEESSAVGDVDDVFMSPRSTSSTTSNGSRVDDSSITENNYIPFNIDEEFVAAIRNELQEKLPCARQQKHTDAPEDDGMMDPEDELSQEERTDITIHYNVYPPPLSPILEERESVSSITTTLSDNYSPFVSAVKGSTKQDSDSEPASPVFVLDANEVPNKEIETQQFEEEIREALENCSLGSGETDSSCDKGQQNSNVLFEDLDQSLSDQGDAKCSTKKVTVVRDTFQQQDDDDDFLVVDTETNEVTLLESPKPKSYLAFVNNKRKLPISNINTEMSPSSDFLDDEMTIENYNTFFIKESHCYNRRENVPAVSCNKEIDEEQFTPDSISPDQDRQVPSSSSPFSSEVDNHSEFFLTPDKSSQNSGDMPAACKPYFTNALVCSSHSVGPTYEPIEKISVGVANNEAEEIMLELENSGILNNNAALESMGEISQECEDDSRTTSESDSKVLSLEEIPDSLKSLSIASGNASKKCLSLDLSTIEQINDMKCYEFNSNNLSKNDDDGEDDSCDAERSTRLLLNDTLDLYKKRKTAAKGDAATGEMDWSITNVEAALLSTKAPMPSPEEESWKQIPSMLAFSDLNEVMSRCSNEENFGEAVYTASPSSSYPSQENEDLMSTSFSVKEDTDDLAECYTPDWESESEDTNEDDNNSSSSGEFIWKEGDREASVKAVDISPSNNSSKSYEGLSDFTMEVIAEEEEEEDDDDDDDDENGSISSGSGTEFVPSAWNKEATPNRSALRSPDKKVDQKKNVSFKKQKYHCVYEYPREVSDSDSEGVDSPSRRCWELCQTGVDYASYADWELMEGDVPETEAANQEAEADVEPNVAEVQAAQTFDFYKLSDVDYDFTSGVMSDDGEFYVSSSSRPFQFNAASNDVFGGNSQFFPGELYQSASGEEPSTDIADVHVDLVPYNNDVKLGDKLSTLGVNVDSFDDEICTLVPALNAKDSVLDISETHVAASEEAEGIPHATQKLSQQHSVSSAVISNSCDDDVSSDSPELSTVASSCELKSIISCANVDSNLERNIDIAETPSPSSPLSPTSGLGELRHTRDRLKLDLPPSGTAFILDAPAPSKRRSVEAVKGEASLLDSGEETEDSGIESSNGASRVSNHRLEQIGSSKV